MTLDRTWTFSIFIIWWGCVGERSPPNGLNVFGNLVLISVEQIAFIRAGAGAAAWIVAHNEEDEESDDDDDDDEDDFDQMLKTKNFTGKEVARSTTPRPVPRTPNAQQKPTRQLVSSDDEY